MMDGAMKLTITSLCLVLICSMSGCNSHPTPQKILPAPAPPPSYPPARPMPLDNSLRESAKREIYVALQSSSPELRTNGVEAAEYGLGVDAAEQIVSALDDPHFAVRFAASIASGRLRL